MCSQRSLSRIAIIGGGISGLSSAYYVLQRAARVSSTAPLDIHIFERKATLGGNADTAVVNLGRYLDGSEQYDFVRWADLGVNDANLATYTRMKQVMSEVGYLGRMLPLQDTTCYHGGDDNVALTDDAALHGGVSNLAFSLQYAHGGRLATLIRVVHRTALDLLASITPQYTCDAYFADCLAKPRAMLDPAAQQLHIDIDWSDPGLQARLLTVRDAYYYPRISAMYFTDPRGPGSMPLQAPFEYYKLQEGGVQPQRCYFSGGAQTWIEALAKYLQGRSPSDARVRIHCSAHAKVEVSKGQVLVRNGKATPEPFDFCVMDTHADDASTTLGFSDSVPAEGAALKAILDSVRYSRGYAVCHTSSAAMPENKSIWRTYNIRIRSRGDTRFPYRIDYVVNLHQNDPCNPRYNSAGLPQYFVSLVDDLNVIPHQDMLDRVLDEQSLPAHLLDELTPATRRQLQSNEVEPGYVHELLHVPRELERKAWTVFKHNVLNAECIAAQRAMHQYNLEVAAALVHGRRPVTPLLFGGGWTLGAGLQEQCLEQSERLSQWLLPG